MESLVETKEARYSVTIEGKTTNFDNLADLVNWVREKFIEHDNR